MFTKISQEQKLRRTLKSAGYTLHKSRIHNANADNLGGYCIVDTSYNSLVAGDRFQLSLSDVEEWTKMLTE